MSKRNLIIGIVVLVALVGGVVLWNQKSNQRNTKQQTKKEVAEQTQEQKTTEKQEITKGQTNNQNQTVDGELKPEEKIDTSNWKTYRNEKLGFEVKYPKEWKYEFKKNNYGKVLIVRPISCSGTYGYYEDDCDDVIIILITDSPDNKLRTISGWNWAISEGSVKRDKCVDGVMRVKLNIDDNFKSCLTNEFGKIHHRYFFKHDNLKYLFTIRYFDEKHSPKVEKTILETFHFTKK